MKRQKRTDEPVEIALVGDMTNHETELTEKFLSVPVGGKCTIYIDSPGGSPYCALSLANIILLRKLRCTGFVTGECSSAALWPFAACVQRYVTPTGVLLFHTMKWQSEEHVELHEAAEWARHFAKLEKDMDSFLCDLFQSEREQITAWIAAGRYVTGEEIAAIGLAEIIPHSVLIGNLRKAQAAERGLTVHKVSATPKVPRPRRAAR